MPLPFEIEIPDAPTVEIVVSGVRRKFDLDEPDLPDWVKKRAFASGGFPYNKKMDEEAYEAELEALQCELVKLQFHLQKSGGRVLAIFEGRDAAGKGGSIAAFRENLNPRMVRTVALAKPSDVERSQWYFQRYAQHLPSAGEIVLFDRSWYNRAGVEPVMGFCTSEQHQAFLDDAPKFEKMVTHSGIRLFKFWLEIGQEMQLKRFHDRRHSPLRVWKLSPIDIKALQKWGEYTAARDLNLSRTDSEHARWTVIRGNDKRRARLDVIRTVLTGLDYAGKNVARIGKIDPKIVCKAGDIAGQPGSTFR
jgi:polyphosphate kinase 2